MTVKTMQEAARKLGIKGCSRMSRSRLRAILEEKMIEIHRGDLRATRRLGARYLRTCNVSVWRNRGSSSRPHWEPRAWLVPAIKLVELNIMPTSQEEAEAMCDRLSDAASQSYNERLDRARERIGALPGSRTARALVRREIDQDLAGLIAFKAGYRHEHTDYDRLLEETGDREYAREAREARPIPADWSTYLETYGFSGEVAGAIAGILQDPRRAHPAWFKEAEIAVRRARLPLDGLTYEAIRAAIERWRWEREDDF